MSVLKQIGAGSMKVKIYNTREEMGQEAAKEAKEVIKRLLKEKKEINVIFAAAPSQNDFLAALVEDKEIEWNRINAFHMDEYIGLDPRAPQGFGNFLREHIFEKVNFKSLHYMNGNTENVEEECKRYTKLLKDYPTDIVCMGIGENGHIAFNDPHVAKFNDEKYVKVVDLDEKCRNQQVNDGCFTSIDKVPTYALTLTIPALVAPEYVFCVVPAKTKAQAVFATVTGEITEACPASILKTHKNVTLYADKDSSSLIM